MKLKSYIAALIGPLAGAGILSASAGIDTVPGTVNFANGAAQLNAPVVFKESGLGVAGSDWKVELLFQTSSNLVSIAGPTAFETGSLAGYFFAGSIPVPGTIPGEFATFRIRIQNIITQFSAETEPVEVILGGGIMPPANLIGLKSLQVPAPVRLSISNNGSKSILSWPIGSPEMALQVSDQLPPIWRSIVTVRSTNETFISTTVDMGVISQFFRLISD